MFYFVMFVCFLGYSVEGRDCGTQISFKCGEVLPVEQWRGELNDNFSLVGLLGYNSISISNNTLTLKFRWWFAHNRNWANCADSFISDSRTKFIVKKVTKFQEPIAPTVFYFFCSFTRNETSEESLIFSCNVPIEQKTLWDEHNLVHTLGIYDIRTNDETTLTLTIDWKDRLENCGWSNNGTGWSNNGTTGLVEAYTCSFKPKLRRGDYLAFV